MVAPIEYVRIVGTVLKCEGRAKVAVREIRKTLNPTAPPTDSFLARSCTSKLIQSYQSSSVMTQGVLRKTFRLVQPSLSHGVLWFPNCC